MECLAFIERFEPQTLIYYTKVTNIGLYKPRQHVMGLLSVGSFKRTIVRDMEHIQNMTSNQLIKLASSAKEELERRSNIEKASSEISAILKKALTFAQ